jgi:hypothetical protein
MLLGIYSLHLETDPTGVLTVFSDRCIAAPEPRTFDQSKSVVLLNLCAPDSNPCQVTSFLNPLQTVRWWVGRCTNCKT